MGLKHRVGQWLIPKLPVSRFAFDLFRVEWNAVLCRLKWRLLPHRRIRLRRLKALRGLYVNVACGPTVAPGFVAIDLFPTAPGAIPWDCSRSLPFADGAVKGIVIEHFVEHVEPREDLPRLLAACHRVLEPGGVLRVIVPDAERFLRAYAAGGDEAFAPLGFPTPFPGDLPTRMDLVNHVYHQWHEHRWGYDFETLADRLRRAGFARVERRAFRESADPMLCTDRPIHQPYSLYIEGIK